MWHWILHPYADRANDNKQLCHKECVGLGFWCNSLKLVSMPWTIVLNHEGKDNLMTEHRRKEAGTLSVN